MKPMLRPLACLLALLLLLLTGCTFLRGCFGTDAAEASAAERQAILDALLSERPVSGHTSGPVLSVTVIDVGQGDSILLISPEGKTMLVDAGPADAFPRIADTLRQNGVSSLDVLVATHPHADHIGAMAAVLETYPVGAFYTAENEPSAVTDPDICAALDRNGCPVCYAQGGMTIPWADSCTVTVLNPIAAYADLKTETNDLSVVLHVRYGDTAVLLTGDAEATAENRMLDTYPRSMLHADVLKLGHHGSSDATGYAFFLAVDPDYAVASYGKDNDYGHPHSETLSLLYHTGTAFFGTVPDGSVTFRLDGKSVAVEHSRKETP